MCFNQSDVTTENLQNAHVPLSYCTRMDKLLLLSLTEVIGQPDQIFMQLQL